jgi:hypothetical protein
VAAIVATGRRRGRTRVVGGSALGVAAVGAAVAVGAASFGGGTAGAASAAAGTSTLTSHPTNAQAKTATPTPTKPANTTVAVPHGEDFAKDYGTTTIASGQLGGTTWKLQRTLRASTSADPNGNQDPCNPAPYEEVYIETPDGVHVDVDARPGVCDMKKGPVAPWRHFLYPGAPVYYDAIATVDAPGKEQGSKYGSLVSGLVDDTKIAKVVLKFDDGRAPVTAQMVKAPAPENGAFFYIPLTDKGPENIPGQLVFYDAAGNVVHIPGMS